MLLSELVAHFDRNTPDHAATKYLVWGVPYLLDPWMKGTYRFARRNGDDSATLTGDNEVRLFVATATATSRLRVRHLPQGLKPGCQLLIGGQDIVKVVGYTQLASSAENVYDIDLEGSTTQSWLEDTEVQMIGYPAYVVGSVNSGSTSFVVAADVTVMYGDVLYTDDREYVVTAVTVSSTWVDPQDATLTTYTVTVESPVDDALETSNLHTKIFLRAYPGYEGRCIVPTLPDPTSPLGPFALEVQGGSLLRHEHYDTFVAISVKNGFENLIYTRNTEADKAIGVSLVPVHAHLWALFDLLEGSGLEPVGTYVRITLNNRGEALIASKIPVALNPRADTVESYSLRLNSDEPCTVTLTLYPNEPLVAYHPGGGVVSVVFSLPEEMLDSYILALRITGVANSTVSFGDLHPNKSRVRWVTYTVVGHCLRPYRWAVQGIVAKSLFKSFRHVEQQLELQGLERTTLGWPSNV